MTISNAREAKKEGRKEMREREREVAEEGTIDLLFHVFSREILPLCRRLRSLLRSWTLIRRRRGGQS